MDCAGRSDTGGGLVGCVVRRRLKLAAIVDAIASTVDPRSGSELAHGAALESNPRPLHYEAVGPVLWALYQHRQHPSPH